MCLWPDKYIQSVHHTHKFSQHSSITGPFCLNGWVFVYKLSGCEFKSCCSHKLSYPNLNLIKTFFLPVANSLPKKLKKKTLCSLAICELGSTVSMVQSHYRETVYFQPLRSPEYLVLILSTLEGWKHEPPSDCEPGISKLVVQHLHHQVIAPVLHCTITAVKTKLPKQITKTKLQNKLFKFFCTVSK